MIDDNDVGKAIILKRFVPFVSDLVPNRLPLLVFGNAHDLATVLLAIDRKMLNSI